MPSSRRLKVAGLVTLLTICIVFYVANGARSTHNSAFYQRTVAAIHDKQAARSRDEVLAEEKQRLERVDRLEKEHNVAISAAAAQETRVVSFGSEKQEPIIPNGEYGAQKVADVKAGKSSTYSHRYMKNGQVVHYKPPADDDDDGVAKVGNIGPKSSHTVAPANKDEQGVEQALNEILRKGPIIIFSKTFCPFSKKAKHILLDLYTISPPPYVVELDEHPLGPGLQSALERTTGRRTVPNILINGMSIGGGDEVQELHDDDALVSKISSMGGKRMQVKKNEEKKMEMRFKA